MKRFFFLIMAVSIVTASFSQSVMTFRPGPGLNDGTDEGGLNGGKDSFVYDEQYNVNYGTQIYVATNPISTCNLTNLQAYMKFDVTSLPGEVDSVFVWFYNFAYNVNCYSNCDNTFDLRYVESEWNEMTLTWENRPASGLPFSDTVRITFPYNGGPVRLDVTEAYRLWRAGNTPNYGFTIYPLDGWCNNACVSFAPYSSDEVEETRRPYLEIFYHYAGVADQQPGLSMVSVFPNPAVRELNLMCFTPRPQYLTLKISDHTGKIVESLNLEALTGTNTFQVDISSLAPGIYAYQLIGREDQAGGKFIVAAD